MRHKISRASEISGFPYCTQEALRQCSVTIRKSFEHLVKGMIPTDTTKIGLIPQRHKYTMQALFWYSLHLFHPQRRWKDQKYDETRSQAMRN